ncbi:MAG: RsmB/NOP family class I SAM-dependent RNA methyltransferase [Bdellovibrionales bacterium]|nr:RsmB/NOP family class I SAM-dependent RNA methyltransferase [Bdellovibrionales bacterium]
MKINRPLLDELLTSLEEVFFDGKYADKVIESCLKHNADWSLSERRFFAETLYGVLRWERLLVFIAGNDSLARVIGTQWLRTGHDLPDWEEFDGLSYDFVRRKEKEASGDFAIRQSIPDWIDELGRKELGGDSWEKAVIAMNQPGELYLRVNSLKATPDDVIAALATKEIVAEKVSSDVPYALKVKDRKDLFRTDAFRNGMFEVQDAGSQMVVPLLDVQPGQRVIDACAGSGGKSLHIASYLQNKGRLISMDIKDWKLHELKLRARRAGATNIETRVIESSKTIKRLKEQADRVLLDVPCTGLGVLRRNPDAKWRLHAEDVEQINKEQYQILTSYSAMTKKGGLMVYSTCSILPSENEQQIAKFLKEKNGDWSLVKEIHLRPDVEGYDGFYAALLKRN